MRFIKKIVCASLVMMPLLAYAGDLKIANRTNFDLSFSINNLCSDKFGVIGSDTIKTIVEKDFNSACEYNPKACHTLVYSRPNCKGEKLAEINFDTSYGVTMIRGSTSDHRLSITANGFSLIFTTPTRK